MEKALIKMCEDLIKVLTALRQAGEITEIEYENHLKVKKNFLKSIKR